MGIGWEAANGKPGANELYHIVMDDIWAHSPWGVLFVVQGAGQVNYGLNWWVAGRQLGRRRRRGSQACAGPGASCRPVLHAGQSAMGCTRMLLRARMRGAWGVGC
jgi:hypothetical protein